MKLLKVALSIFCIASVVKLHASDTLDIEQAYIGLIIKITSMSDDIESLQEKYKLLSGEQTTEGLDLELAFFNLKKKVDNLNNEILSLKEQYELLTEKERVNAQKISELFEMLELKVTNSAVKEAIGDSKKSDDEATKIYDDARKFLVAGENEKAIELFQKYLEKYQDYKNFADATYWLGRAWGTVCEARWTNWEARRDRIASIAERMDTMPGESGKNLAALARRPDVSVEVIAEKLGGEDEHRDVARVMTDTRYEGYVKRQQAEIRRQRDADAMRIPESLDVDAVTGLRTEAAEALARFRPATLGQASRLAGVTPADATVLAVAIRKSHAPS